ncbi:MBL fold metallo-hydrolase [Sulfurimonas gotlandica]|nr:MBL fold metallo-hydrolase [Sulfurimonas gotlandica]EDZ62167.1 metallo-beta-lactamase domain protein [Sulfurimonas gotlandica GD1]
MKSLLILLVFIHSLLAFDYTLKPQKVSAETHCFFGLPEVMDERNNGNMVNSCFVNMGTSYLVIDSGPTYLYAKQAYSKMKEIKDLPISYVINTHTHDDHYLGNSFYNEIGVDIVGSNEFENETKLEKTRMQMNILEDAYSGTKQVFPNILVENKTISIDAKEINIESVNKKAHTKSDLLIYIPEFSTIFVGDLVFNERIPSIRDGNLKNWIEALDKIKSMDVKYIIGGHGKIVDKSSIDATYKYLTQLVDKISLALENGIDIADTVNNVSMKDFKDFKMYGSLHRQNVEIAYRMLEWSSE